jgi:hypothetical protein
MTTTITTLRSALASVVTSLTPSGTAHGRSSYQVSNKFDTWGDRAASDIDREISIGRIAPGSAMAMGLSSEAPLDADFELTIGHYRVGDAQEAMGRRDGDIEQIVRALEDKANYPSDVHLIRFSDSTTDQIEDWWITTLTFRIIYSGDL